MKQSVYTRPAIWLHWISALLILGLIPGGLIMVNMADGDPLRTGIYRFHAVVGIVVLLLTAARLIWLARVRWPAPPEKITGGQRWLFLGVHVLLYVGALVMTLSGITMLQMSGIASPLALTPEAVQDVLARTVHSSMWIILLIAFVLHLGGVIQYQLQKGDALGRMGVPWFGKKA